MKLKDNFFKLINISDNDNNVEYTVKLNPSHFIYKAHFPVTPVTPGVCIIQIIKELSIDYKNCNLTLKKIEKIKFTNTINPIENEIINFILTVTDIEENKYKVNATVLNDKSNFAKTTLIFEKINE